MTAYAVSNAWDPHLPAVLPPAILSPFAMRLLPHIMRGAGANPAPALMLSMLTVIGSVHAAAAGVDTIRASIRPRNLTFEDPFTLDRTVFMGRVLSPSRP